MPWQRKICDPSERQARRDVLAGRARSFNQRIVRDHGHRAAFVQIGTSASIESPFEVPGETCLLPRTRRFTQWVRVIVRTSTTSSGLRSPRSPNTVVARWMVHHDLDPQLRQPAQMTVDERTTEGCALGDVEPPEHLSLADALEDRRRARQAPYWDQGTTERAKVAGLHPGPTPAGQSTRSAQDPRVQLLFDQRVGTCGALPEQSHHGSQRKRRPLHSAQRRLTESGVEPYALQTTLPGRHNAIGRSHCLGGEIRVDG